MSAGDRDVAAVMAAGHELVVGAIRCARYETDPLLAALRELRARMDDIAARQAALEESLIVHARAIDELNARLHARRRGRT